MWCAFVISGLGRGRQEDPWDLLINQYSFLGELQASEGPCLKIIKMLLALKEHLSLAFDFHIYMHTHAYPVRHMFKYISAHMNMYIFIVLVELSSR